MRLRLVIIILIFTFLWQQEGWAWCDFLRPLAIAESNQTRRISLHRVFQWVASHLKSSREKVVRPPISEPESEPLVRTFVKTTKSALTAQIFIESLDRAISKFNDMPEFIEKAQVLKKRILELNPWESNFVFEHWPFTVKAFNSMMSIVGRDFSPTEARAARLAIEIDMWGISVGLTRALKAYREAPVIPGTQIRIVSDYEEYVAEPATALRKTSEWKTPELTFQRACRIIETYMHRIQRASPQVFKLINRYTKVISFFYSSESDENDYALQGTADLGFPGLISLNTYKLSYYGWPGTIAHESRHQHQRSEGLSKTDLVSDSAYMFPQYQQSIATRTHTPYGDISEIDAELSASQLYLDLVSHDLREGGRGDAVLPFSKLELEMVDSMLTNIESMSRSLISLKGRRILTERGEKVIRYLNDQMPIIRSKLDAIKLEVEKRSQQLANRYAIEQVREILSAI